MESREKDECFVVNSALRDFRIRNDPDVTPPASYHMPGCDRTAVATLPPLYPPPSPLESVPSFRNIKQKGVNLLQHIGKFVPNVVQNRLPTARTGIPRTW